VHGGSPLFFERNFTFAQRVAATGTEIFIEVLIGQDQQQTFTHRHRLGASAAIESGGFEGFELFHINHRMKPDPTRVEQANNIVAPSPEAISRAVKLLRDGQLVGLPTETVYGLAGDGMNPTALARIFETKQRPLFDPLILHFADAEAAFAYAEDVPEEARRLAEKFWPGPLTLVLRKKEIVPDLATSGMPNMAVRVPSHPVAQALLRAFDGPLAAPSANRFGRISPTDARAVHAELGDAVPLILDGGPCAVGLESTIIMLHSGAPFPSVGTQTPVLLRAGGVPLEKIEGVVGPVAQLGRATMSPEEIRATGLVSGDWLRKEFPVAPGQLKTHYAPRKSLRLTRDVTRIPARADVGLLVFANPEWARDFPGVIENVSPKGDLREAAANFFRALRKLDDDPRVTGLYAMSFPNYGLGLAINERLERASA
jgi:L-threonylcarbamoyladenylate synthase